MQAPENLTEHSYLAPLAPQTLSANWAMQNLLTEETLKTNGLNKISSLLSSYLAWRMNTGMN